MSRVREAFEQSPVSGSGSTHRMTSDDLLKSVVTMNTINQALNASMVQRLVYVLRRPFQYARADDQLVIIGQLIRWFPETVVVH